MHFTSYITDMEGMEENSNSDYMDEMLEYDAVVEDDCDISSDIADAKESLTDEEDHSATDSNPYEAALGRPLVGTSDGTLIVPTFEWTSYFAMHFRKIIGIKKYHHFHFDSSLPGTVIVQERCDTEKISIQILKDGWMPSRATLPQQVFPKGLSAQRQWYLYDKIRSFCPESDRGITCPLPSVPKPVSRSGTPNPDALDSPDSPSPPSSPPPSSPPPKRLCGLCRKPGHNSRRCPDK